MGLISKIRNFDFQDVVDNLRLRRAVKSLGSCDHDVAYRIENMGIKGDDCVMSNPVAKALEAKLGFKVIVARSFIAAGGRPSVRMSTPDHIAEFLFGYIDGRFHELRV